MAPWSANCPACHPGCDPGAGSRVRRLAPGVATSPAVASVGSLAPAPRLLVEQSADDASSAVITLLVVDDVAMVRRGLQMRLSLERDLRVVGEAASGAEALAVVRALQPDVVLMDIEMPGIDGLMTTEAIRQLAPGSAVVTLSMHDDAASRARALAAGARAFVGKSDASDALLTAIRAAASQVA